MSSKCSNIFGDYRNLYKYILSILSEMSKHVLLLFESVEKGMRHKFRKWIKSINVCRFSEIFQIFWDLRFWKFLILFLVVFFSSKGYVSNVNNSRYLISRILEFAKMYLKKLFKKSKKERHCAKEFLNNFFLWSCKEPRTHWQVPTISRYIVGVIQGVYTNFARKNVPTISQKIKILNKRFHISRQTKDSQRTSWSYHLCLSNDTNFPSKKQKKNRLNASFHRASKRVRAPHCCGQLFFARPNSVRPSVRRFSNRKNLPGHANDDACLHFTAFFRRPHASLLRLD